MSSLLLASVSLTHDADADADLVAGVILAISDAEQTHEVTLVIDDC